jgi:hypothetical protein
MMWNDVLLCDFHRFRGWFSAVSSLVVATEGSFESARQGPEKPILFANLSTNLCYLCNAKKRFFCDSQTAHCGISKHLRMKPGSRGLVTVLMKFQKPKLRPEKGHGRGFIFSNRWCLHMARALVLTLSITHSRTHIKNLHMTQIESE